MTTTKVQAPRKLTENEDNDSFDDFWFQVIWYYSRDESFKPIFNDPNYIWAASTEEHRGLGDATSAANLNILLRALATYASKIKASITDHGGIFILYVMPSSNQNYYFEGFRLLARQELPPQSSSAHTSCNLVQVKMADFGLARQKNLGLKWR